MEAVELDEASVFLAEAEPLLLGDEARHNLVLGIAATLTDAPAVYEGSRLWLVRDGRAPVAAALRTPPFNLVLAKPEFDDALVPLANAIARTDAELPGVTGALPEADRFSELWLERTGGHARVRMRQRIYRATSIRTPAGVRGASRQATTADRALLLAWLDAFSAEALDNDSPAADSERWLDARLAGAGGFVIWEDGEPVSFAGWGGATPNGVRVGPVYTPPQRRRHGYGSAVTATVSAERLADGRQFCFLYTDLANPTSNRIYMDIGYEPVCDSVVYAFEKGS